MGNKKKQIANNSPGVNKGLSQNNMAARGGVSSFNNCLDGAQMQPQFTPNTLPHPSDAQSIINVQSNQQLQSHQNGQMNIDNMRVDNMNNMSASGHLYPQAIITQTMQIIHYRLGTTRRRTVTVHNNRLTVITVITDCQVMSVKL